MLSGQRIVCVSQLSALLAPARNAEYHLGLWTKLSPLQLSSPTGARAPEGQGYHTVLFPLRLAHGQRSLCSSKGMSHFSHDLGKSLLGQVRVPQEGFQGTGWVRPQVLQGISFSDQKCPSDTPVFSPFLSHRNWNLPVPYFQPVMAAFRKMYRQLSP